MAHGWTFGRPIIVTDLRNPGEPRLRYPMDPVDLFRRDGFTAYSHDVQVDDAGIAWVSGDGGTRGYHTSGRHYDSFDQRVRTATAARPDPVRGRRPARLRGRATRTAASSTTPGGRSGARPEGRLALPQGRAAARHRGGLRPGRGGLPNRGQFTIASLKGSYGGEAWRSRPRRTSSGSEAVGTWNPFEKEGSRPIGGPYDPNANFCSAHYFDVDGSTVTYAWYGEGTRFLDISDPENPTQFAYWRPDDGIVWASYLHDGYVYTADRTAAWTC